MRIVGTSNPRAWGLDVLFLLVSVHCQSGENTVCLADASVVVPGKGGISLLHLRLIRALLLRPSSRLRRRFRLGPSARLQNCIRRG